MTDITQLKRALIDRFVERDEAIEVLLTGLLARQHVLLLGPPGTAKTRLAETLGKAIGARFFSRLLTKFSTPEEVFGPISLRELERDRYVRLTDGYLPSAQVAFLDEVGKASSAIANALLRIMADRAFDNDGQVISCPLEMVIGACNELPEGEAFFDRFPLRAWVGDIVDDTNFRLLLRVSETNESIGQVMSIDSLHSAQRETEGCTIGPEIEDCCVALRHALSSEGFRLSPRTWAQVPRLIRATAYLRSGTAAVPEDCCVIQHMAWARPEDRAKVAAVIAKVASPSLAEATAIYDALVEQCRQLDECDPSKDRSQYLAVLGECNAALKDGIARIRSLGASGRIADMAAQLETRKEVVTRRAMEALGL